MRAGGRATLVALIVAATALFVVGTTIERSQRDSHATSETAAAHSGEATHAGEGEAAHRTETAGAPASSEPATHGSETIAGVDPESAGLVAVAAALSLLLAAAVWRWPRRRALLLVGCAAMLAFAALDVREVVHQLDESRSGLAVLAAGVAALHLSAAALSGRLGRASPS